GLQPVQPVAVGVGVDLFGRGDGCLVDRQYDTRHGRVHIGGRLDRLDDRAGFSGLERSADLRQLDEDEVAQRLLRVIGDAGGDRTVRFAADPFVACGVFELGGYVHRVALHARVVDRCAGGVIGG